MPAPEQNQNLFPQNPEMADLLTLYRKQILTDFMCHHIGIIQSFDPETQTGTATVAYKKTLFAPDAMKVVRAKYLDYPVLTDCPVVFLGGGDGFLTFPVEEGDECLLIFNDRSLNNWFEGNQGAPLDSGRLHSLSDGIILCGIRSKPKAIPDFDMERARLQKGTATVAVGKEDKVLVENESLNLKTVLTNLTSQLSDLTGKLTDLSTAISTLSMTGVTPGGGASGPPMTAADFVGFAMDITMIGTNISSIATDEIGGLLE